MGSPHFRNARDHNQASPQEAKFATAYVLSRNPVTAALSAGYPSQIAMSVGCSLLAKPCVQQLIAQNLPEDEKAAFENDWGLDIVETETLAERVQAQRERLALAARGGLPLPAEITFTRKPLSRRSKRVAKHQEA